MSEPLNLNRLAYFSAVVDTGSFTRAAERLGITKAVVSQQVARLEKEVGTTLLIRTTRQVHPTEAGRSLHARCVMILREAEDAFGELAQSAKEPTGTLRITAPNDYGTAVVVPIAAAFSRQFPNCQVQLDLSDKRFDLQSGEWDLAIRLGWLTDSSLQARRIGSFRQFLVGASSFIDRLAPVQYPDELSDFPFIANSALNEPLAWHFSRGDLERRVVRMKPVMFIDSTPAVLRAVREEVGLAILPDFLAKDDLASGEFVHAVPDWQLPTGGIYTVYPAAQYRPPKVVAFVIMLAQVESKR